MTVSASQVFDFLERHRGCMIERREVYSAVFGGLRRSLRSIAVRIGEADEGETGAIADRLRLILSEWLTTPILFDGALLEALVSLGDAEAVETRWGCDVRAAYEAACAAALTIQSIENPMRAHLSETLRELTAAGRSWRIYCHKRARTHFESLSKDASLFQDCFLHSIKDYRDAVPFDVLVKVGPLRSRGWSAAPDAIISAPRFTTMIQVVWSGCADEDGFGYDPVAPSVSSTSPRASVHASGETMQWTRRAVQVGDRAEGQTDENDSLDELRLFSEVPRGQAFRRATLVEIDEGHGILYPPQLQVASFDTTALTESPLGFRLPGETLLEGMFVVRPILADSDLGGLHATDGYYSRIWKEHLRNELARNAQELVHRLRTDGLNLLHILPRVKDWCRPPSTVIHAPQQRKHFEILIKALGIDNETQAPAHPHRREWWHSAWTEIAHSRGEAIQTGLQEHEIVNEELFAVLAALLPEIRRAAAGQSGFQIQIPAGKSLRGVVRFHFVRSIEEGFIVPENILGTICDLDTIEQWRD